MDTPKERESHELAHFVSRDPLGARRFRLSAEDAQRVREAEKVSQEYAVRILLELLHPEVD